MMKFDWMKWMDIDDDYITFSRARSFCFYHSLFSSLLILFSITNQNKIDLLFIANIVASLILRQKTAIAITRWIFMDCWKYCSQYGNVRQRVHSAQPTQAKDSVAQRESVAPNERERVQCSAERESAVQRESEIP